MSSSVHFDNKKEILILGKGPTQGLDDTTLNAEKKYSINFTEKKQKIVQACILIEQIIIYLLMAQKFLNLKQKILKL